ncbi:hypothetical protein [Tenggerimyces flavus]|uniref:Uncharacterized protein n=1 Tax=Tenggerimyces flavus TaxID=1708749 RepID=A0ABV7YB50_9ACTN|nr:hypothetical protein [Tenggerimyces flavus]MBM7788880.1 hypothetical protein [Tenggerimyces flavus]
MSAETGRLGRAAVESGDVLAQLAEIEATWLQQCASCDAMLPASCTCPPGDPRAVIGWLVDQVKQLGGQRILDAIDALPEPTDHQVEAEKMLGSAYAFGADDDLDRAALRTQAATVHALLAVVERLQTIAEQGPGGAA